MVLSFCSIVITLFLVLPSQLSFGEVTFQSNLYGFSKPIPTSTFVYYGGGRRYSSLPNRSSHELINGSVIFLESNAEFFENCHDENLSKKITWVKNKVVFINLIGGCPLEVMIHKMNEAGAQAVIALSDQTIPGILAYYRPRTGARSIIFNDQSGKTDEFAVFDATWMDLLASAPWMPNYVDRMVSSSLKNNNRSTTNKEDDVSDGAFQNITDWSGLTVNIKYDHHDYTMRNIFRSAFWVLILRVLIPSYAFWTAYLGIGIMRTQLKTQKQPFERITFWIAAIEVPGLVITGFALIVGTFGPMLLPVNYHLMLGYLFIDISLISTVLLLLMMHEKTRVQRGLSERNVLHHYRYHIYAFSCMIIGFNLYSTLIFFTAVTSHHDTVLPVFLGYQAYIFLHIIFGTIFLKKAHELGIPLLNYLNDPDSNPMPGYETRIRNIVRWTYLAGASMFAVSTSLLIFLLLIAGQLPIEYFFFPCVVLFSLSRVTMGRAQIEVISNSPDMVCCAFDCCTSYSVQPDPSESRTASTSSFNGGFEPNREYTISSITVSNRSFEHV